WKTILNGKPNNRNRLTNPTKRQTFIRVNYSIPTERNLHTKKDLTWQYLHTFGTNNYLFKKNLLRKK
ncbi:hypothetical protein ABEU95_14710, partial [Heyndrickxia faecalis]|uniref:hypothetical protein n=1 Tax=Heyndrickxia faecalis TaxID=2824910 RepID=UPI003D237D6E